jgi:hypothetical protein
VLILQRPWDTRPPIGVAPKDPTASVWTFEIASSLIDAGGRNNGTINGATWTVVNGQAALNFNGAGQDVDLGPAIRLTLATPWAFTFVGKVGGSGTYFVFGQTTTDPPFRGTQFYFNAGNASLELDDVTSYHYKVSNVNLNDGLTHTVSVSYDGSSTVGGLRIFIDGVESGYSTNSTSGTPADISTTNNARIGSREWGGGRIWYLGSIQYAEYRPRAISVSEHRRIHAARWESLQDRRIYIPYAAAAGGGTTYTISPSGSVAFSGAVPLLRTRVQSASGTVTFSGASSLLRTRTQVPSGTVTFSGAAPITFVPAAGGTTYTITPSGGFVFSGTATQLRTRVQVPSGNVAFSGAVPLIRTRVQTPTSGVTFSGTSGMIFIPAGGVPSSDYSRLTVGMGRSTRIS